MPHKSENGKIITSKTPLLSNHSTKISNQESLKGSNKMKTKASNGTVADQRHVTTMKNGCQKPKPLAEVGAQELSNGHEHSTTINKNNLNVQNHDGTSNQYFEHVAATPATEFDTQSSSSNINGDQEDDFRLDDDISLASGHGDDNSVVPVVNPLLKNGFLHFHPSIKDLCDVPCRKNFINTFDSEHSRPKKIYRVVLTGGPCGGKTTGQARLCSFFENMGWKVFRVPEAATVLLGGGIKFSELSEEEAIRFQEELLRTMMQIESVFFRMAETIDRDVLIICDRGTMDASAFIKRSYWEDILGRNNLNEVDIRDTRYNQIIHMVSAANGAEPFYTTEDHVCRSEGIQLARELDKKAAQAWVGHPYFDVVDNSSDFEAKVCRMIQCVCQKLGIDAKDRLEINAKKVKFLVKGPLPPSDTFPSGFQDFTVVHDYLQSNGPKVQARLRKRGKKNHFSYTYTVRRPELQGQVVEVKTTLTQRDYNNMLAQRDHNHVTVYKSRRCFLLNNQYFQLDVYKDPCHPRCKGLILLETYSTLHGTELYQRLPKFLNIVREATGDPRYSMFNLSLKERWVDNKYFCKSLTGAVSDEHGVEYTKSESQLAS